MTVCTKMIENGTVGFQCRVRYEREGGHLGPCAAPERGETMRQRAEYLASIGHHTADPLSDPVAAVEVASSSLAAHVAADSRLDGAPEDPNEPCPFCLGISSDLCPECKGSGLAGGAVPGPFFFVHHGAGKPLEAYSFDGDDYTLVASLGWQIKDGQPDTQRFRCSLSSDIGKQLGRWMIEFLQDRASQGILGVAYDGRAAPVSEESLSEMEEVADRPMTELDPRVVEHENGEHDAAPREDCVACHAAQASSPEPMKQREGDQPLPEVNDHGPIQDLVISDIERRKEVGVQRYGTLLQPENGRDMARDAYEEVLDLAVYFRGTLAERAIVRDLIVELTGLIEGVFPPQGVPPSGDGDSVERIFAILDRLQRLFPAPE